MKCRFAVVTAAVAVLGLACTSRAQTCQYGCELGANVTFTWNGSIDNNNTVELATINGLPVNQTYGYAGSLQVLYGQTLWLLTLPEPGTCSAPLSPDGSCPGLVSPSLPNNGFLDCETALTYGLKQWGVRADGTAMDGTKAGDSYTVTETTSCPLWNGTTSIVLTPFRQIVQRRVCVRGYHGTCFQYKYVLFDVMISGTGSATVTQ